MNVLSHEELQRLWCRHHTARPDAPAVTLDALLEMDYPASDFEVIVVDDGSDAATERVVRARQKGPIAMEYRAQPNSGAATARNHGARVAAGRHVFFCDDDIVVQRDHLRSVSGTLGKFSNALVNGDLHFSPRVEEELRRTPFGRYRLELDRRYQAEANGRPLGSGCFEADLLTACNLGVARDLFWELGGFDEAFPYAGAEDQALSLTASKQGCLLLRDHRHPGLAQRSDGQLPPVLQPRGEERSDLRRAGSALSRAKRPATVCSERPDHKRRRGIRRRNQAGKAALSREPVLAALHRLTGRLEQSHVPERVLRRMYRTVVGLHIFRGVRIAAGRESLMARAVSSRAHQRLARVKRRLERLGAERLPGYGAAARKAREIVFPALAKGDDLITIRMRDLLLEVPPELFPVYLHRDYEPLTTHAVLAALHPGAVAVDVGANLGYFTCLAAKSVGPRGVVHAVEPAPANVEALERNIRLNELDNVVVHPVAAAEVVGVRTLRLTAKIDHHGLYDHPDSPTVAEARISTAPLDALVDVPVKLIKVDVEGAEVEVLQGMAGLLRRSPGATVIVEWNPDTLRSAGRLPSEVPRLMQELGIGAPRDPGRPGSP